ncbi:arsenate reductase (glutaredoxin) [Cellulophaga sp. Hel_I_12]|uniref:arsenate reductase (glutaredoxin) n=1 Tax=Cellulophaga sp. Hel_I_12 TaxID=1249972 RepID=UPI000645598E|nr:arsenate reductase (glutaredoxin) [Cellulophaga sp. Hel_I_12]
MIKIYHNPRCGKSREGLAILEASGKEFEVIKYLDQPLSKKELQEILKLLKIPALSLIRKNEAIWKQHYKGQTLTEDELIQAFITHPKLIERPIVINNNKAIIGRPPEAIKNII